MGSIRNYSDRLGFGSGSRPKPINLGLDSEFNSIHFGIEINKCLKFLRPKKFLGPKILRKYF
jgi:hypothetical protein